MEIAWDNTPDLKREQPYRRVLTVKLGEYWRVRFLGELVGVWTHYVDRRTRPCVGSGCEQCALGRRPRWYGYVPALGQQWIVTGKYSDGTPFGGYHRPIEEVILELSETAYKPLDGRQLRGIEVDLKRPGKDKRQPMRLQINEPPSIAHLPEPFDPRPVLYRLWGISEDAPSIPAEAIAGKVLAPPREDGDSRKHREAT